MAITILVVDDEKEIVDLVGLYMENEGYDVKKAYSAAEAIYFVENCAPSLAILDVMLPDMDGFMLCSKLREKYMFPIIMLTAKIDAMEKITGLTLGADDYLTKPFFRLNWLPGLKHSLDAQPYTIKIIKAPSMSRNMILKGFG